MPHLCQSLLKVQFRVFTVIRPIFWRIVNNFYLYLWVTVVISASLSACVSDAFAMDTQTETVESECSVQRAVDNILQFFTTTKGSNKVISLKFHRWYHQDSRIVPHDHISKRRPQFNFKTLIKESDLQLRDLNHLQSLRLQWKWTFLSSQCRRTFRQWLCRSICLILLAPENLNSSTQCWILKVTQVL